MNRGYHEDEFCAKSRPQMTTPLRPAPPNVKALEDKQQLEGCGDRISLLVIVRAWYLWGDRFAKSCSRV